MLELIALAGLFVAGLAVAAVMGVVFLICKIVIWAVFLPFRLLFLPFRLLAKLLWMPFGLATGVVGLAAGAVAIPVVLTVGIALAVLAAIAAVVALLVPLIPFVLLGLVVWAATRKKPVVVS